MSARATLTLVFLLMGVLTAVGHALMGWLSALIFSVSLIGSLILWRLTTYGRPADPRPIALLARCDPLHHPRTRGEPDPLLGADVGAEPVFAPAAGTVGAAEDGQPDRYRLHLIQDLWDKGFSAPELDPDDIGPFAGNHVILESRGVYVFLAHLKNGSVEVEQRDEVQAGQQASPVGSSGQILEPHLHFQLFDQVGDLLATGAPPFRIASFERLTGGGRTTVENEVLQKRETVQSRGDVHDAGRLPERTRFYSVFRKW